MPFDRPDPAKAFLERAFAQHREELIRYFKRNLRVRQSAEDLAHDVYLRLIRTREPSKIKDVKKFLFWLAYRVMVDEYHREKTRHRASRSIDSDGGEHLLADQATPGPDEAISEEQQKDALKREISLFPSEMRTVFMLYHYGDHSGNRLTVPQISALTGLKCDAVKYHIRVARRHLRALLGNPDPSRQ